MEEIEFNDESTIVRVPSKENVIDGEFANLIIEPKGMI
jgi:hypothetical protein